MIRNKIFRIMILITGIILVSGCDDGRNDTPVNNIYRGTDLAGNEYTLTFSNSSRSIKKGDSGTLRIKHGNNEFKETPIKIESVFNDTYKISTGETGNTSEIEVTIKNDEISSVVGEVILPNGDKFIVRTFDTIYLRAVRFTYTDPTDHDKQWGENYNSINSIKLNDIYNGDINNFFKASVWFPIKITGNVDIDLEKVVIDLQYYSYERGEQIFAVGGAGDGENNHRPYYEIKSGNFTLETFFFLNEYFLNQNVDSLLMEGEIIISLCETISWYSENEKKNNEIGIDGKIPEDIQAGTIMATIRNLKIEPVSN